MTSADLTRRARQSDGSFIEYTIKGLILPGGASNAGGVTLPNIAKWAHTLYTSDVILEGDRILDADNILYDVHQCQAYFIADQFEYYMCELLLIDDYTLQSISFGAADTYTGWYAETYSDSTVYGCFSQRGQSRVQTPAGYYGRYDYVLVTADALVEADRIEDVGGNTYKVELVQKIPSRRVDFAFNWYVAYLVYTEFASPPTTSGTWHLDSDSLVTDTCYRWKLFLQTYITAANIKKDNAATNASTHIMFYSEDYPIPRLLLSGGKNIDAVATIRVIDQTPLYAYNATSKITDKLYAFIETVEIALSAVSKSGITAENVLEQFKKEIEHVITDHAVSDLTASNGVSIRSLDKEKPTTTTGMGEATLHTKTVTVNYKIINDEYTNSGVTVTYGDNQGSTYTIPVVSERSFRDEDSGDARMLPLGRIGNITQFLGLEDFEVVLTLPLDLDAPSYSWRRPQTTDPKTDRTPEQVFKEIKFGNKYSTTTQAYQNLNFDGVAVPVRLTSIIINDTSGEKTAQVTFRRYSATAGTAYKTWYGIT